MEIKERDKLLSLLNDIPENLDSLSIAE